MAHTEFQSLVELLRFRSEDTPERLCYEFLGDRSGEPVRLTCGSLVDRVRRCAALIQSHELQGERVLLLLPPGVDFTVAFFACLYAGATAVPCYPPGLTKSSSRAIRRIASDSGARGVLTLDAWRTERKLEEILRHPALPALRWIFMDEIPQTLDASWSDPMLGPDDLAFLQYTSGTTGDPKGVMVSHGNLLSNLESIRRSFQLTPDDYGVSWLPPFHDMGLIGGILSALYVNYPATLMTPASFLRRPLSWLQAISERRATYSGAPNFGYELCLRAWRRRVADAESLDLSSWHKAFNGSEMVRSDTVRRFHTVFGQYGLPRTALMPCYGMAENTLLAAVTPPHRRERIKAVDRDHLREQGRARDAGSSDQPAWRLVSCGPIASDVDVRVVDPDTQTVCEPGQVGEIWVKGRCVTLGYWNRPEQTDAVFNAWLTDGTGPFLRSGDHGFFDDGELYITGRAKDTIVLRGRNYAAEDIEESVRDAHPVVKAHRCMAFAIENGREELLAVSVECDAKALAQREGGSRAGLHDEVLEAVRDRVAVDHGLPVDIAMVLKSGATPVTTSGKLQRRKCRDDYLAGRLTVLTERRFGTPDAAIAEVPAPLSSRDGAAAAAPQAAPESESLAARLQAVIKRETGRDLGVDEEFSSLALDSLAATELTIALSDEVEAELPLSLMEAGSTLGDVVRHVTGTAGSESRPEAATPMPSLTERLRAHQDEIDGLRQTDLLCYGFAQQQMLSPTEMILDGQPLTVFSSYSYLGLIGRPEINRAKKEAIDQYGSGAHGVMMLGGYTSAHRDLERQLARNYCTEDALLYSSGYAANIAAIGSIMSDGGMIFCDMLAHTSIRQGCQVSGAEVHMFPHQDADALARMLDRRPPGTPALVIVDGVYSLRGDIADLPAIVETAHARDALVMVDEAHSLGAIGRRGRGTAEYYGLDGQVDVITGGLGKGIPAYGGYVAGQRALIEYLRFRSKPYVYSGGMDPANVAAASQAMQIMERTPGLMDRLRDNIVLMNGELASRGIPSLRWDSPCMPVVCGDEEMAYALSAAMRRRGFYIAPITYPAVPKEEQGLRLTVTASHDAADIKACADALQEALAALQGGPRESVRQSASV